MWPFTPKSIYDRYRKLMKLIMSIDFHFEVTENIKKFVCLFLSHYKRKQLISLFILRIVFFVIMFMQHHLCLAQRSTGYGRGLSSDSFSFGSPDIKETIILLLVAITTLTLAVYFVKLNEKKEGKMSNVLTALTFLFGLTGFGAALPLVFNYWYVVILIIIGIALYGAYKDK